MTKPAFRQKELLVLALASRAIEEAEVFPPDPSQLNLCNDYSLGSQKPPKFEESASSNTNVTLARRMT
jgi:hypothetical protein